MTIPDYEICDCGKLGPHSECNKRKCVSIETYCLNRSPGGTCYLDYSEPCIVGKNLKGRG